MNNLETCSYLPTKDLMSYMVTLTRALWLFSNGGVILNLSCTRTFVQWKKEKPMKKPKKKELNAKKRRKLNVSKMRKTAKSRKNAIEDKRSMRKK